MKNFFKILLSFILMSFIIFSCKKLSVAPAKPTIMGRWNILSDSTTFILWGSLPKPDTSGQMYPGVSGDYFNFASNGKLYINDHEKIGLDTAYFKSVSDTSLLIQYFYTFPNVPNAVNWYPYGLGNGTYIMTNLTDHSVTLTTTGATPDGIVGETFKLGR